MKSRMKNGVASNIAAGPYPAINASYWQPAPVPSPYLVPGRTFTCHEPSNQGNYWGYFGIFL